MSGTLTLEAAEPLVVNSTRLIKNLNSYAVFINYLINS